MLKGKRKKMERKKETKNPNKQQKKYQKITQVSNPLPKPATKLGQQSKAQINHFGCNTCSQASQEPSAWRRETKG